MTHDYRGLTVCKTGAWGQGPAGLQQLALLEGFDVADMSEAELVHVASDPNTRDYPWQEGVPYRLRIARSTSGWEGSITDCATGGG